MPNPPFNAFTVEYSGIVDQIVTDIGLSIAFDPNDTPKKITRFTALWDTGANKSVVHPRTVVALGLESIGSARSVTTGGRTDCKKYLVNVFLPNNLAFAGVTVIDCAPEIPHDVIIGMDIISRGDLAISHRNKTVLSFRAPSFCVSDFAREADRMLFAGAYPNSACPCGKLDPRTGKAIKFKYCHAR